MRIVLPVLLDNVMDSRIALSIIIQIGDEYFADSDRRNGGAQLGGIAWLT
jgi:hypothetical protein